MAFRNDSAEDYQKGAGNRNVMRQARKRLFFQRHPCRQGTAGLSGYPPFGFRYRWADFSFPGVRWSIFFRIKNGRL